MATKAPILLPEGDDSEDEHEVRQAEDEEKRSWCSSGKDVPHTRL